MQGKGDEQVPEALGRPVRPKHRASAVWPVYAGSMTRKCGRCKCFAWFGPNQLKAIEEGMSPCCVDCFLEDLYGSLAAGMDFDRTFLDLGNPGHPLPGKELDD